MSKEHIRYSILDTAPEAAFDRLTELASRHLRVPVSIISILDDHRQFFKSQCGLPEPYATTRETPLSHSFCKHVAANAAPLIVEDARVHPLVRDNGAIDDLGVIAYLGIPLFDDEGGAYGALCAISNQPRQWSEADIDFLSILAAQVMSEILTRHVIGELTEDRVAASIAEKNRDLATRADRHDLRTPLNALLLSIQAARSFGGLTEDHDEMLQMAERNGRALAAMIDKMLDINTLESRGGSALAKQRAVPGALIDTALSQVSPLAHAKSIAVETAVTTGQVITVDIDKIVRVLVNLLGNAVKFTPDNGRISIGVSGGTLDGQPAVNFCVRDSGIGIKPENITAIFDDGFHVEKLAPTSRSMGLGLTFCKRTIEAHGGRIHVESTFGSGSTFTVLLPVAT